MNMQMKYLDEPLAVSKIDFVPVPMAPNFQAMENWGLILITESFFFYDDQVLHVPHSFEGLCAATYTRRQLLSVLATKGLDLI